MTASNFGGTPMQPLTEPTGEPVWTGATVDAGPASAPETPAQPPLSIRQPVTVESYVRPAGKDVPGLIRAPRDGTEDSAAASVRPPVEPLFSNEGIVSKAEADRRRRKIPLLGWVAGAAGLAILAAVVGSFGTSPPPNTYAADSSPSTLPIAAAGSQLESIMGASAEPSSTTGGAIADESPSAGASPSSSSGVIVPRIAPPAVPPVVPPVAPRTAPPTAPPTVPPTPVVTPTPTPVITPEPAVFVGFEPDGTRSRGSTATSTAAYNSNFTLFVDTLPGAACTLSEPSHPSLDLGTSSGSTPAFIARWGRATGQGHPSWAVGTYTVTVTCTLSGHAPGSAQKVVHIT